MSQKFSAGKLIADRYEILGFVKAGGMQEVYRSHDHTLNRTVALKTPKAGIVDKRFHRGAQMGARVSHPNLAATFDYIEDDGQRFLAEEFIRGKDLGLRLENEFIFLDPSLAAHVFHHVAKGLQAAHSVGIAHRDLKPSNIMTSSDGQMETIKLTDFGIAKLAEKEIEVEIERFERDENTLTQSNTLLGAVPYMAPECWSDWSGAGQPMDIWALGCIGFHLLSGKPPFGIGRQAIRNVTKAELAGKADLEKPRWFGRHTNTGKLEKDLWKIIQSCIEIKPEDRPSAAEVVSRCDDLLYFVTERKAGIIAEYAIRYPNGGRSKTGYIEDAASSDRWFFHLSEFFGEGTPQAGQRVSVSVFSGSPRSRCSPVLLLRQPDGAEFQ